MNDIQELKHRKTRIYGRGKKLFWEGHARISDGNLLGLGYFQATRQDADAIAMTRAMCLLKNPKDETIRKIKIRRSFHSH